MPRSRPITRSSNKNPLEITVNYLEEHAKYLQRCLRRSEQNNLLLEQKLETVLEEITTLKEECTNHLAVSQTRSGMIGVLRHRIAELESRNKELERQLLHCRRTSSPNSNSWAHMGGPWEKQYCPPYDRDGMLIGYEYKLNPNWVRLNPGRNPGPRPLSYQEEQERRNNNNNNNNV